MLPPNNRSASPLVPRGQLPTQRLITPRFDDTPTGAVANVTLGAATLSAAGVAPSLGALSGTLGVSTLSGAGTVADSVPKDGPSSTIFVPATGAHFTALGITVPDSLWLFQEASGDLADSIGAVTMTANNTPLYSQSVTNWSRVGIGFNNAATQRFAFGTGTYDPTNSSTAVLVYARNVGFAATPRFMWVMGAASGNNLYMSFTSTGLVRITCFGNNTSGASDYDASDAVHPFLFVYDITGATVRIYTDTEQVNGTYNAGVVDSAAKGPGTGTSGTSMTGEQLWACQWHGANAETIGANAKTTLEALGWTVTGY